MNRINSIQVTRWLLPGLAMVLLTLALVLPSPDRNQATPKSLTEQEDSGQKVQLQDFKAVVPIVKVMINHGLYLIFESTLLAEFDFQEDQVQPDSYPDSYLEILFRRIISINAP